MSCLGVLFAVPQERIDQLEKLPREARVEEICERIEEEWFEEHREQTCEMDKAWDAMHRALTGGKLLYGEQPMPMCWVILGGKVLYGDREDEDDYIIVYKSPKQVKAVAQWLPSVSKREFQKLYFAIDPQEYGMELDEEDFEYTWEYFSQSAEFWKLAAEKNLPVLFTVDQ